MAVQTFGIVSHGCSHFRDLDDYSACAVVNKRDVLAGGDAAAADYAEFLLPGLNECERFDLSINALVRQTLSGDQNL